MTICNNKNNNNKEKEEEETEEKKEKEEAEEEEKKEKDEEENCCGRTDGRVKIESSTNDPRGPKKKTNLRYNIYFNGFIFCEFLNFAIVLLQFLVTNQFLSRRFLLYGLEVIRVEK